MCCAGPDMELMEGVFLSANFLVFLFITPPARRAWRSSGASLGGGVGGETPPLQKCVARKKFLFLNFFNKAHTPPV